MDSGSQTLVGAGWLRFEVEMHRASRAAKVPVVPSWPGNVVVRASRPAPRLNDSLSDLLRKRRSQRFFDDRKLASDSLFDVVVPAFLTQDGQPAYAVPGAIPSITVIALVNRLVDTAGHAVPQGVYEISPDIGTMTCLRHVRFEHLTGCVDMSDLTAQPAVVLLLCLHLCRRRRYLNAYELGLIEAGQVLQNLSMTAAQAGIGACVLGSVFDEPLWSLSVDRQDLSTALERHGAPIVAVALGRLCKSFSGEE